MPFPEAESHVQAFMDCLRVSTPDGLSVELAVAPAGHDPYPYAVVYPDGGGITDGRLSAERSHFEMVFLLHAVGIGPEQCLWVVDKCRNAVIGKRLVVPNRVCHRITQDIFPSQMMRDWNAQADGPVYQQMFEFELRSEPA